MKAEMFDDLMESMRQAVEHAKGKRDLRTTVLPAGPTAMRPKDVKRLRRQVNASQAVFAHYLNVSTQLVQAWESGRRRPEGAALRLLHLGKEHPSVLFADVTRPEVAKRNRATAKARPARANGA